MGSMIESRGKRLHDRLCYSEQNNKMIAGKCFWVPGAVIVGAGPSGLAVAACLKDRGVPSEIIERDNCIASLWQHKTYDRLRLHLPKQFCELPLMPFPSNFPTYPTKQQFISYLESYAQRFDIRPRFNERVDYAAYDQNLGLWRLRTLRTKDKNDNEVEETEYVCRWMVVATGENAEEVIPKIEGTDDFLGPVIHSSSYKTGESFYGKRVLVVGCGNSGMEVCLDLCNYNARPSLVVREALHILPREMLGRSTFGLSMWLLKWLPIRWVDRFLLFISRFMLGDTTPFGLVRPSIGPLELKNRTGKTPVLDVGTLTKIRNGDIKIYPAIKKVMRHGVEFVDERVEAFDAIVFATGYRSNVPTWLKEKEMFSEIDGLPKKPFPNGWKGRCGLYAVGFTKRGLLGASVDARRIALDIESSWKADAKHLSHSKPLFTSCHS